jgi:hypothetical protein
VIKPLLLLVNECFDAEMHVNVVKSRWHIEGGESSVLRQILKFSLQIPKSINLMMFIVGTGTLWHWRCRSYLHVRGETIASLFLVCRVHHVLENLASACRLAWPGICSMEPHTTAVVRVPMSGTTAMPILADRAVSEFWRALYNEMKWDPRSPLTL